MYLRGLLLTSTIVLASITSAAAAVINFTTPDIAATMECDGAAGPKIAPLERYEEQGVRVLSNELFGNRFLCDPARAFGVFGEWQPLMLQDGETSFGPLVYWWNDSAGLDVTSLGGQAIRGIDLTIVEKGGFTWCSEIIQSAQGSITLCNGFDGYVSFADRGFPNGLTSFRLDFGQSGRPHFLDPFVRLNAIDVPEPAGLALVGVALAAVRRRRRARR
jgi:MYXO-CTERM domain-containing protein